MPSVSLSITNFMSQFLAVELDSAGMVATSGVPVVDAAAQESLSTGLPAIKKSDLATDGSVAMTVPVYKQGQIVSMAGFLAHCDQQTLGVMEVWQPIGVYDELSLTLGYFGAMERFQNVTAYVRFEKGSGLPGQVWENRDCIILDNLPSHPGFLRAAGASADSLQLAIGMPVEDEEFLASVLLISSDAFPIAKAYEVWHPDGDQFTLTQAAYQRVSDDMRLEIGAKVPVAAAGSPPSLVDLALQQGAVVTGEQSERLWIGRDGCEAGSGMGIAIPFYQGDQVHSVLVCVA